MMCIHPICQHFHKGSILSKSNTQIIVKFFTNELGVHKVNDTQISLQFIAQTPAMEEPQNLVESAKKKNSDSKENNVQPQENPSLTEQ